MNDGDAVSLVCSIAFRGLASDIHIGWLHDEGPVGGSRDDDVISVRRTLVFNASYPQSSGVYRCYVSSRQFNYSATCRTELMVLCGYFGSLYGYYVVLRILMWVLCIMRYFVGFYMGIIGFNVVLFGFLYGFYMDILWYCGFYVDVMGYLL